MPMGIAVGAVEDRGERRTVVVAGEEYGFLDDLDPQAPRDSRALIAGWAQWRDGLVDAAARSHDRPRWRPVGEARWLAPVEGVKVICVGANYHDHVAEMEGPAGISTAPAPFPFSFLKPDTALTGSGTVVRHPAYGSKLDWEAELAVVVGDPAADGDPLEAVFGYTILNDLSLRDFIPFPHALGLDAVVSKGFDGAAPIGPWVTPAEYVPDPQDLSVRLAVNGETMQDGSTRNMIFGVRELVAHFARVMTLRPGDVIATGTPAGVGAGRRPPRFLTPGDEIAITIGQLGCLRTSIGEPTAIEPLLASHRDSPGPADSERSRH
jgi:2,4-diketo-3-deoxy-L-fuconate hydrolase